MLDEPGCAMEPTDDAHGNAGVMVAFGMCGPLIIEEFDEDEERPSSEKDAREAGQRAYGGIGRGWRFWRRFWWRR